MASPREESLSLVVPLFNEAAHLESTLSVILHHLDALQCQYEVILVDDGSTDSTWESIRALCSGNPSLRGYRLSRNFGKEGAVSAGLRHARGNVVAVMDGDLQHPPELLGQMLDVWRSGEADVVEAVKRVRRDDSLLRTLGGRLFNRLYTYLTGYDLAEATDYKVMDRRVVDEFLKLGETRIFYRGMIAWLGFRHHSVEFEVQPSARAGSVWSVAGLAQYALSSLTSFTSAPLHLVTLMGLLTLAISVPLGAWTLLRWVTNNSLAGFSTVIVVQLFGNGIIMLSLGVIGEYLGSIYQESKRRPRFIISESVAAQDATSEEST